MHGVDADDGGEQGGETGDAADVVAFGLEGAADATVDGGADFGEFHVQDRAVAAGLGGLHGSFGNGEGVAPGISFLTGNGAGFQEGFHAVGFALSAEEAGFDLGDGSVCDIEAGLFKAGVDFE